MIRDAHAQLPFGAVRLQAFCQRRRRDLQYLGRHHSRFRIAATEAGQEALAKEFVIEPTEEKQGDMLVVTVRNRVS